MREITTHKVNGCNSALRLTADNEPGLGGANHRYTIHGMRDAEPPIGVPQSVTLEFQNGPIKEFGTNGLTQEVLLAVLIDRLEGFQSGPFACDENAEALFHLKRAVSFLNARTEKRVERGVEGTHEV